MFDIIAAVLMVVSAFILPTIVIIRETRKGR